MKKLYDGLSRKQINANKAMYRCKLKPLYENSLLSYYWMGFIMSDGNMTKEGKVQVEIGIKDINHLIKLANFLNIKVHTRFRKTNYTNDKLVEFCKIKCEDSKYGRLLLKKFHLSYLPKTYHPPNKLDFPNNKYFLAFLIGFIDGDGHIRKSGNSTCNIKVNVHHSWLKIFEIIKNKLKKIKIMNVTVDLDSHNQTRLVLYKHQNLLFMKRFALNNHLPLLERKWDKVDENHILKKNQFVNESPYVYPKIWNALLK